MLLQLGQRQPRGRRAGGLTFCLIPPQEKRLSVESALSEDSRLSAGTTSQGEPEGLLAEAEGLGQQEAAPAAQDEDAEESYEEVRLAAEGAFQEAGAAHPSPSLSFQAHAQSGPVRVRVGHLPGALSGALGRSGVGGDDLAP